MKTKEQRKEFIEKVKDLKVTIDNNKVEKDKIDEIIEKVENKKD